MTSLVVGGRSGTTWISKTTAGFRYPVKRVRTNRGVWQCTRMIIIRKVKMLRRIAKVGNNTKRVTRGTTKFRPTATEINFLYPRENIEVDGHNRSRLL